MGDGMFSTDEQRNSSNPICDDASDLAELAADLHQVALLEGLEQQDHDPGGEVRQRTLQREADGEADRAEHGDERGHLDAELADGDDEHHHGQGMQIGQGNFHQGSVRGRQLFFELRLASDGG